MRAEALRFVSNNFKTNIATFVRKADVQSSSNFMWRVLLGFRNKHAIFILFRNWYWLLRSLGEFPQLAKIEQVLKIWENPDFSSSTSFQPWLSTSNSISMDVSTIVKMGSKTTSRPDCLVVLSVDRRSPVLTLLGSRISSRDLACAMSLVLSSIVVTLYGFTGRFRVEAIPIWRSTSSDWNNFFMNGRKCGGIEDIEVMWLLQHLTMHWMKVTSKRWEEQEQGMKQLMEDLLNGAGSADLEAPT